MLSSHIPRYIRDTFVQEPKALLKSFRLELQTPGVAA